MKHQKYSYHLSAVILGIVLLIGLWIQGSIKSNQMPSYQGKTVDEWFWVEIRNPGSTETRRKAKIAFKAMGTNCIPFLLEKARVNHTPFKRLYREIHPKLPPFLKSWIRTPVPNAMVQNYALRHLRNMPVTQLDSYAPVLMTIAPRIENSQVQEFAYGVVDELVMRIDNVETQINYFLPFLRDPNFNTRLNAALALSRIDNTITNGIPTLTTALTNRSSFNSTFGGIYYPSNSQGLKDLINDLQQQAYEALIIIDPELAKQYEKPEQL